MTLKVKLSIPDLKKVIKEKIEFALKDQTFLNTIGEDIRRNNFANVVQGKNPEDNSPLDYLQDSSIRTRKYLARYNKTSSFYKDSKSNVTVTGQFMESIKPIIEVNALTITLKPTGTRSPYLTKTGRPIKGQELSNEKIGGYLSENNIKYLGINETVKRIIKGRILAQLRRRL